MSERTTAQRRRGDAERANRGWGADTAGIGLAPGALQQALAAPSGGVALDPAARAALEPHLGHNFADVRVHADAEADRLSRAVNAVAFTSGQDIYFRSGAYAPDRPEGLHLLAHEAAHTLQQAAGPVAGEPGPDGVRVSDPGDPFEQAADRSVAGGTASTLSPSAQSGPQIAVQRFLGFPGVGDDSSSPLDLGGALSGGISGLGSAAGGLVSGVGSLLGGAAAGQGSALGGALSDAGSGAGGMISGFGSMVGSEVSGVGALLGSGASTIGGMLGLGDVGSAVGGAVSGGASTLGSDIAGLAGAVGGDVADTAGTAGGLLGGLAGLAGGGITGAATGLGDLISGAASDVGGFVSGLGLPGIRPEDLQM